MKYFNLVVRSSDNLRNALLRSTLTMLAIGIGAFAMTMGLALNLGGEGYLNKIISSNTTANSLWVMKKIDDKSSGTYPSRYTGEPSLQFHFIPVSSLDQDDLDTVKTIDGVKVGVPRPNIDCAISSYSWRWPDISARLVSPLESTIKIDGVKIGVWTLDKSRADWGLKNRRNCCIVGSKRRDQNDDPTRGVSSAAL